MTKCRTVPGPRARGKGWTEKKHEEFLRGDGESLYFNYGNGITGVYHCHHTLPICTLQNECRLLSIKYSSIKLTEEKEGEISCKLLDPANYYEDDSANVGYVLILFKKKRRVNIWIDIYIPLFIVASFIVAKNVEETHVHQ